jgi:hypothetical protein
LDHVKKSISTKIQILQVKLGEVVTSKFKKVSEALTLSFKTMKDKIAATYESVDEVIAQIEYVKMLAKNDYILDDLETELLGLQGEKEFVDNCKLKLPSDVFMNYLSLYLYPSRIRGLLESKLTNVAEEKKRLAQLLSTDIEQVNHRVEVCQHSIDGLK